VVVKTTKMCYNIPMKKLLLILIVTLFLTPSTSWAMTELELRIKIIELRIELLMAMVNEAEPIKEVVEPVVETEPVVEEKAEEPVVEKKQPKVIRINKDDIIRKSETIVEKKVEPEKKVEAPPVYTWPLKYHNSLPKPSA
jgi:hypothetical protein